MTDRFVIGQEIQLSCTPKATVIGIDRYVLFSHSGKHKNWVSYTLTSEVGDLYKRFWVTDEPSGIFCWTGLKTLPTNKGLLNPDESGVCALESEGDNLVNIPYSSVLFYEAGDIFYCSEVFYGSTEVFYMQAKKAYL